MIHTGDLFLKVKQAVEFCDGGGIFFMPFFIAVRTLKSQFIFSEIF